MKAIVVNAGNLCLNLPLSDPKPGMRREEGWGDVEIRRAGRSCSNDSE